MEIELFIIQSRYTYYTIRVQKGLFPSVLFYPFEILNIV